MKPGTKNALMIIAPIVIAGAIIYFVNKKKGDKKKSDSPATDNDVKATSPSPSPAASGFPLKQGSSGEKVKTLQRIIGANPDGQFGPLTENALITFAGVRTVDSQAQLDALQKKATGISGIPRANDLLAKFTKFMSTLKLYVPKTVTASKITVDAFGAITKTGTAISLPGGKTFSREDYVLSGVSKEGQLLFDVTKGTFAGKYQVDPSLVSLA